MKLRILASALVLAAVTSAPASAMISKQDLDAAVNASAFNTELTTVVNGDTVTIFGMVEGYKARKVRQAALSVEGVNKVISRLTLGGSR